MLQLSSVINRHHVHDQLDKISNWRGVLHGPSTTVESLAQLYKYLYLYHTAYVKCSKLFFGVPKYCSVSAMHIQLGLPSCMVGGCCIMPRLVFTARCALQCSHCKRCTSYSNSVRPSDSPSVCPSSAVCTVT